MFLTPIRNTFRIHFYHARRLNSNIQLSRLSIKSSINVWSPKRCTRTSNLFKMKIPEDRTSRIVQLLNFQNGIFNLNFESKLLPKMWRLLVWRTLENRTCYNRLLPNRTQHLDPLEKIRFFTDLYRSFSSSSLLVNWHHSLATEFQL